MTEKEQAIRTRLMKLEAMSLFASIRAYARTDRWWYFDQMKKMGRNVRLVQSLSAYRASLHCDYLFRNIECQLFIEREALVGNIGENHWSLSVSGIEGKVKALTIQEELKCLQQDGFYIPNGNENLERQMNFSLGLYGACLMHVDVKFPAHQSPLESSLKVLDMLDQANRDGSELSLEQRWNIIEEQRRYIQADEEDEGADIIMGDWQTWK